MQQSMQPSQAIQMTPQQNKKCRHRDYENYFLPNDKLESKIEQIKNRLKENQTTDVGPQQQSSFNCSSHAKLTQGTGNNGSLFNNKSLRVIDPALIGYKS